MRKLAAVLAFLLVAVAGCSSTKHDSAKDSAPSTTHRAKTTTTAVAPTTLPIVSAPSTATSGPVNPAATGKILMIKLYVGNLSDGEKFYGSVFGAKHVLDVGADTHIMTLPGGGPGLVLLKAAPKDKDKQGAFIMQVPDLDAAKALAVAQGAKVQGTFGGAPNGQAAQSIDLLDPWNNQVEILHIG